MTDSLDRLLRELHLPTVLAQAQAVAIEAERSGWSFTRYLYTLAELELEQRRQHRIQRRRKESGLPSSKTLTTLQLTSPPSPFWGRFFTKDPKTGVTKPSFIGHGVAHLEVYLTHPEENNDVLPPSCNRMGHYDPDPLTALE